MPETFVRLHEVVPLSKSSKKMSSGGSPPIQMGASGLKPSGSVFISTASTAASTLRQSALVMPSTPTRFSHPCISAVCRSA
jgi:hypothetical protein